METDRLDESGKVEGGSKQQNISFTTAWPQVSASVAAMSTWFSTGVGIGFSAVLLPQLASEPSAIPVSPDQASWIAGLLPMCTVIGAVGAAWLVDRAGRLQTTRLQTLPLLGSWALTVWAPGLTTLYASRVLMGVAAGMVTASTTYVTEVAHPELRGALCNLALLWGSAGTLAAYLLGAALHWRHAALVCCLFPLLTFAALTSLPESPRWLLAAGRRKAAEEAVYWIYRRDLTMAASQWQNLQLEVSSTPTKPTPLRDKLATLLRPSVLKPVSILFGFFIFQQFSGCYVMLFYTVDLFRRIDSVHPFMAAILVGLVRLITSGAAVVVSRRVGRRPLACGSGLGMTVSMAAAASCVYLTAGEVARWVSLLCVLLYMLASALGFLCLPWSMTAELLPLDVRGAAGVLCNTANYWLMFAMLKIYPPLAAALPSHGILWFFAATSLAGTLFVYLCLPETLGKTLLEIEQSFTSKNKQKITDCVTEKL